MEEFITAGNTGDLEVNHDDTEEMVMHSHMARYVGEAITERRQDVLRAGEKALQDAVGVWATLRLVIRGYLRLDEDEYHRRQRIGRALQATTCAVCAVTDLSGKVHSSNSTRGEHFPLLQCSRCKTVAYCSREHQKKHWNEHKVNLL